MLPDFAGRSWLLVLIACVPAAVRWLAARSLMRRPGDPLIAERILAMNRRSSGAAGVACGALVVIGGAASLWSLPLLVGVRLLAGYPIRRALLGETWSLGRYLSFFLRLMLAMYGFWLALGLLPLAVSAADGWEWLVGGLLAVLLTAWNVRHPEIVRALLRSRPLDEPVAHRFQALCALTELPTPRFEQVTLGGGVLANAVAVPSSRIAAILFTDTLLSELTAAEADAICAHELAHLEHYDRRRVTRMQLVTALMIVAGGALVPAARALGATSLAWPLAAWYVALAGVLVWRGRHRQHHETASDLRAVELCRDPDALVRGLTRLYAIGRVPRRLDAQVERLATHPSLARRIRDIRRATGVEAARLGENVTFAAPDGSTVVTFEPSRVQWNEGDAAAHVFRYTHLADARLAVTSAGPASLVVVERGGRRWTMPLESGDVARAQAVLDLVDGHLAEAPRLPGVWPRAVRVMALMVTALALLAGQLAAALLAVAAAVRPGGPLLTAAGVGALAAAALTLRDSGWARYSPLPAFALAAAALALLVTVRGSEENTRQRPAALALLAGCAVLALVMLGIRGIDAISVHEAAREISAATVLPLALAAALFRRTSANTSASRESLRQAASLASLVLAAFAATAASPWFLDRFGHDLFLVRATPSIVHTLNRSAIARLPVSFFPSDVRLSPTARALAVAEEDTEDERGPVFHVGTFEAGLVRVDADDVAFVDDERVLLLVRGRQEMELREAAADAPDVVTWRQRLPGIAGARLTVNPGDGRWQLLGWNRAREVLRLQGRVGQAGTTETRWRRPERAYINALAADGDRAVLVESHYDVVGATRASLSSWLTLPFSIPRPESRVWTLGPDGAAAMRRSRFGAQCVPHPSGGARLICAVFDGTATRVMAIGPGGEPAPVASFDGRFFSRGTAGSDWICGWWGSSAVALRLSTGESIRIAGGPGEWVAAVGRGDSVAAAVGYENDGWIIRLIPILD